MLAPEQRPLKPPSPLQPKNARETPISHPQRRWRFQLGLGLREQRRRRFHARDFRCSRAIAEPGRAPSQRAEPHISDQAPLVWRAPEGPQGLAAVPVGGGGAWPGFETTRRAKLAARTARGRAAAHGHTEQPGPTAGSDGARNTSGAPQAPPNGEASELLVVLRVLVGLAAVGAAKRTDRRHLLGR